MVEAVGRCLKKLNDGSGDENWWVRPVAWRGTRNALEIRKGALYVVPRLNQDVDFKPLLEYVLGEWEIIDPEVVLKEML